MQHVPEAQMFQKDPDQHAVPAGHVAYILRYWGVVYETGVVTRVRVTNGLPHLTWVSGGNPRLAHYPDEVTRVFVKEDADIDARVFSIPAKPVPKEVPRSIDDVWS